jgi:hypothetical protein
MGASIFVFQLRPHCPMLALRTQFTSRPNEILTCMAWFNLCLPAIQTNPLASIRQSSFRVLHTGLVGRLSSGKYFASRAVAAGLSDRDGRDTLHVVSVLHLGLGNTLVWPGRCIYGHQKMHRKTQCGCCCGCCCFLKFLIGWDWFILGVLWYKGMPRGIAEGRFWTGSPLIASKII